MCNTLGKWNGINSLFLLAAKSIYTATTERQRRQRHRKQAKRKTSDTALRSKIGQSHHITMNANAVLKRILKTSNGFHNNDKSSSNNNTISMIEIKKNFE